MELVVRIRLEPKPEKIDPKEFDALCDGALSEFERWFESRQRSPAPLLGVERGVLKAYLYYLATKEEAP